MKCEKQKQSEEKSSNHEGKDSQGFQLYNMDTKIETQGISTGVY